jgi:hypothetical protein
MAELCSYSIVKEATFSESPDTDTELVCAALIKREDSAFIDQETFDTLPIQQKRHSNWFMIRTKYLRVLRSARQLISRALKFTES